jgi:hypothetical protein
MTTTLSFAWDVHWQRRAHGAKQVQAGAAPLEPVVGGCLPRVSRLMALALRFDELLRSGAVKDYATLARLGQVTTARISQITHLLHLAPDIQEALLFLAPIEHGRAPLLLADLLPIASLADWKQQRRRWRTLTTVRRPRTGQAV